MRFHNRSSVLEADGLLDTFRLLTENPLTPMKRTAWAYSSLVVLPHFPAGSP